MSVQQIFSLDRCYRVPFYQRKYVWSEGGQWARLMEDILEKTEARLLNDEEPPPHYMGAVVLEPQKREGLLGLEIVHIIDGQQRMTTLQFVMQAIVLVARELNAPEVRPSMQKCMRNSDESSMRNKVMEAYKLWPTFADQPDYKQTSACNSVLDLNVAYPAHFTNQGTLRVAGRKPLSLAAVYFFCNAIKRWVVAAPEEERSIRLRYLAMSVLQDLKFIVISLGPEDDAQVIFETMNGRGAVLHASDLIRNFIFMRADREGADGQVLYNDLWQDFENGFWDEVSSRGRITRPNREWFFQVAVAAATRSEVDLSRLYAEYQRFAGKGAKTLSAEAQLNTLVRLAAHYRDLTSSNAQTLIAKFGRRLAPWEASTVHPLAVAVADSAATDEEKERIYGYIMSYLVRRAVCGLTTKNLNNVFLNLLKGLPDVVDSKAFFSALAELSGDASRWPKDADFQHHLANSKLYPGALDPKRIKAVLVDLESGLRGARTEFDGNLLIADLDVDHVMPQSWYQHWPYNGKAVTLSQAIVAKENHWLSEDKERDGIAERELAIPTIGNLTLAHYGLNRSAKHCAFEKKREMFFEHSNLSLNRILMTAPDWDEAAIKGRAVKLCAAAMKVWPGPA
jgi:hypothetical protein